MRVSAPVLIAIVLELPVDGKNGLIEVDILTAEAECLLLPEAEREANRPTGAVPAVSGQPQKRAGLSSGKRLALGLLGLGRVDQRAGVPEDDFLTNRDLQRAGKDAVNLNDRVCR
jgi:hypothetical protein